MSGRERELVDASKRGDVEVVRELVRVPGIDLEFASPPGYASLQHACAGGHVEVVKVLLGAGASVTGNPEIPRAAGGGIGWTPVFLATMRGHWEVVRELVRVPGFDVNREIPFGDMRTPLFSAVKLGHWKVVRELLRVPGIAFNGVDHEGRTPLMRASEEGRWEAVRELLRMPGIDVNVADYRGFTPLTIACYKGHWEVARELVRVPGIAFNGVDDEGRTPLLRASLRRNWRVVRELLRLPGIDVNRVDSLGQTALTYASARGFLEVVRQLLRVPGIDVDLNPGPAGGRWSGCTALWRACVNGHAKVANALVSAGADVHARSGGRTLVEEACKDHGGVRSCVRSARSIAGPMLKVLLLGGLPREVAVDMVVEGLADGVHGVVAVLLRAGAHVPPPLRRSERLRQRRI